MTFSVPYPGVTNYGDSLSAVVALSVMGLAQGHTVPAGLAMTGTITSEGDMGPVGGLPVQLLAAGRARILAVLISSASPGTSDGLQPSLPARVVPASSVMEAFRHIMNGNPAFDHWTTQPVGSETLVKP